MRQLSIFETFDFLDRHPDVNDLVLLHESIFSPIGGDATWSQLAGDYSAYGHELPIPPRGLAIQDSEFGNVVIFPDAEGVLHYSGDVPADIAAQVQRPVFKSDPQYLEMYSDMLRRIGHGLEAAANPSDWFNLAAIALAAYVIVGWRR